MSRDRWRRVSVRAVVWALALAATATCTGKDGELGRLGDGGPDASPTGCGLISPVVQIRGRATCVGRLASAYLSNALCSCGNVQVGESLATRGFDSTQGPLGDNAPDEGGASVGVNATFIPGKVATAIGGSFSVAGTTELTLTGRLAVRGDLWAAGNLLVLGPAAVARNASFAGNYMGLGPLTVKGSTRHAGSVTAVPFTTGSDQPGPVTIPSPCACGPGDLLDVAAIVDAGRLDNDNASLRIAPDAFETVIAVAALKLPCGRAYLSRIGGAGSMTVHVTGKSVLFIEESIDLKGALLFDVAPGAEVDVFVKGDVAIRGSLAVASKDRPAAGRLWVGGSQPITLLSPWVGNLYAPRARVASNVGLDVWGSIFAGEFSGDLLAGFTFDRSIAEAGGTCGAAEPPPAECRQCGVCSSGAACVSGVCGGCTADSDCCSLSVCANGRCAPFLDVQGP